MTYTYRTQLFSLIPLLPANRSMLRIIDTVKTRLFIQEADYDLDVPIQVEIEYRLKDKEVSL